MRKIIVLEQSIVDDVLNEHRNTGREIQEILECLRDEGHLSLDGEQELHDAVRQCSLAQIATAQL